MAKTKLFFRPEVQTVPGYSSLMETRLGVAEERITRTPAPVSVASSHGRVKGPEYPRRPNLAPATLRPIARPTPPSRDRWLDLLLALILLTGGGRMNMMSAWGRRKNEEVRRERMNKEGKTIWNEEVGATSRRRRETTETASAARAGRKTGTRGQPTSILEKRDMTPLRSSLPQNLRFF